MESTDVHLLGATFEHLVLPSRVSNAIVDNDHLNHSLLRRLSDAWTFIRDKLDEGSVKDTLGESLSLLFDHSGRMSSKDGLLEAFAKIESPEFKGRLAIHVTQQNAAILIYRENDEVFFESFEVSPSTASVLETSHVLKWDFPGRCAAIPLDCFRDESFQESLATFIEEASDTAFDQFAARAWKAGKAVIEPRDTAHPGLVTEMLMSLLEAIGRQLEVCPISKRVRDDVVLDITLPDGPWRRSPYWLVLRILARRVLEDDHRADVGVGRLIYKFTICALLANFLVDCVHHLDPEKVLMIQAKLCRRLAKLETEKTVLSTPLRTAYQQLLDKFHDFFFEIVSRSRNVIWQKWTDYQRKEVRSIPRLPPRVQEGDTRLLLLNSGKKFDTILAAKLRPSKRSTKADIPTPDELPSVQHLDDFGALCSDVVRKERELKAVLTRETAISDESTCESIAKAMMEYFHIAEERGYGEAQLTSRYLLNLFEAWVAMDLVVTKMCPILLDFHPIFVPEALDMLCIVTQHDMDRLSSVQRHLAGRNSRCRDENGNIFGNPSAMASFARAYLDSHDQADSIALLGSGIDAAAATAKAKKVAELGQLTTKYQKLGTEIQEGVCVCKRNADGTINVSGCNKCWKKRSRRRIKIRIHEDFLPARDISQRAAILLELQTPRYLSLYRTATWALARIGLSPPSSSSSSLSLGKTQVPELLLSAFTPLKPFHFPAETKYSPQLTLASRIKSFHQTHYSELKLPRASKEVLLPFGAKFSYYDVGMNLWLDEIQQPPWYHSLLGVWIPDYVPDPFGSPADYMEQGERPSSYEIAAREVQCPMGVSVHEFAAAHRLVSGVSRRWLVLFVEIESSNLDLGSGMTEKLFRRLTLQAGPASVNDKDDVLREFHQVFKDLALSTRFQTVIESQLNSLAESSRNVSSLSIFMTLSLKLYCLVQPSLRERVSASIRKVRDIGYKWIEQLRGEARGGCVDGKLALRNYDSAFRISTLCRQSFTVLVPDEQHGLTFKKDVGRFIDFSIAFSENLMALSRDLSATTKNHLIQDLSTVYSMKEVVHDWIKESSEVLETCLKDAWADIGGAAARVYSSWTFSRDSSWIVAKTLETSDSASQIVHYHMLYGNLLVDGKPLGNLPSDIREDPAVKELFPGQHLLTRPSGMTGMEYHLVTSINDHEVHIGRKEGHVFIRAKHRSGILEHIPRETFIGESGCDLPSALVNDCVHWLNLTTGQLEIRRKPKIWQIRPANWILDVIRRQATRGRSGAMGRLGTRLVEPRSAIGRQIQQIFSGFEHADKLTVYQPISRGGSLSVELKRLELRFAVNEQGCLQSAQLGSEIDPDQQIGTLHGLKSMITLRDCVNRKRRSILVPIGAFSWTRDSTHVSIHINNEGTHVQFAIDPELGRLACAPEPVLLYLKSALHALTSFPLPDQLTGRTGTEEALRCLESSYSQPWTPLNVLPKTILDVIRRLSPTRSYYPKDKRLYQTVQWDKHLTTTIQHEKLTPLVQRILEESRMLEEFAATGQQRDYQPESTEIQHLALRGMIRRQVYERFHSLEESQVVLDNSSGLRYRPRDSQASSVGSCSTFRIAKGWMSESIKLGNYKLVKVAETLKSVGTFAGFTGSIKLGIKDLLESSLSAIWAPMVHELRMNGPERNFQALFDLSILAFAGNCGDKSIAWLLCFDKHTGLKELTPPDHDEFTEFQLSEEIVRERLKTVILPQAKTYDRYCINFVKKPKGLRRGPALDNYAFNEKVSQEADSLMSRFGDLGPNIPASCEDLHTACNELAIEFLKPGRIWHFLEPEFQRLKRNQSLSRYIMDLNSTLASIREQESQSEHGITLKSLIDLKPVPSRHKSRQDNGRQYQIPCLGHALCTKVINHTSIANNNEPTQGLVTQVTMRTPASIPPTDLLQSLQTLKSIVQPLLASQDVTRMQYGKDLEESIDARVRDLTRPPAQAQTLVNGDTIREIGDAKAAVDTSLYLIRNSIAQDEAGHDWLHQADLWPCVTISSLLELLRAENMAFIAPGIKAALTDCALKLTRLQRLLRLEHATLQGDERKMAGELQNVGHENWDPLTRTEWLLLEIDNDLLIRPIQVEVANAIIDPSSGNNSVLQMNMGSGKTSCVVPMSIIELANRHQLCRVVVPKALLLQTAQVMQSRLGGLVGRRVQHVPYNRQSPSHLDHLDRYWNVHKSAIARGSVMICLPEHVLSFKLSGLQKLGDEQTTVGRRMLKIQRWLDYHSRDILDESDLTLSVQTQLIYPSGQLTTVDGNPLRWHAIQELLSLTESHTSTLEQQYGGQIEIFRRHNGYPIICFLTTKAEDGLMDLLIEDVCSGRLPQLQMFDSTSESARSAVKGVICGDRFSASEWNEALTALVDSVFGAKILYLLRGLISQRILILCFKKRWNVQYGLHLDRSPIAVPFEAKGVPSPRAEYGHPDTALILTCLAFYQAGLTLNQVKASLDLIMKSDDPAARYERWVGGSHGLPPPSLQYWSLIDPDSEAQMSELWKHLRYDRMALNHYMNTFVFPSHAKQFSIKLQASGWDIPLIAQGSLSLPSPLSSLPSQKTLTTGFSGTNDNKRMLPQTIRQDDLPTLLGTNAEVLSYLLETRNRNCFLALEGKRRLSEDGLLKLLRDNSIRVLIDAGAYILEMANQEVASAWLNIDHGAEGAVFFGQRGELLVSSRFKRDPIPLHASSLADSLDKCVVYIDESHTRGTDLRLPVNARGALTLGLNQTKDHTVQGVVKIAAMRLRQLGSTQSVAFIAPPEVARSILDVRPGYDPTRQYDALSVLQSLTSEDVVRWLLEQSCRANDQLAPLYLAQCQDYCRRMNALWKYPNLDTTISDAAKVLRAVQQQEHQTLEQLYGQEHQPEPLNLEFAELQKYSSNISSVFKTTTPGLASALMEVEQEREVIFDVEQIREKESNHFFIPLEFPGLDRALLKFIRTGDLRVDNHDPRNLSNSFVQAFDFVGSTKIGQKYGVASTGSRLFVSREFCSTVVCHRRKKSSVPVRPVHWVLWSQSTQTALVIIPEEADLLLPLLREIRNPRVWLFAYAAPVTRAMQNSSSLTHYSVPTWQEHMEEPPIWLSIEVGVLGGRLYFDFDEYEPSLQWLGLSRGATPGNGLKIAQPLGFLKEWLTLSRRTDDVMFTPMGFVCQRKTLKNDHFFFRSAVDAAFGTNNPTEIKDNSHDGVIDDLPSDSD